MTDTLYPPSSRELAEKRQALAPETEKAFQAFSRQVFADGALPGKTKQLIAVAVAHVTQCPYCIKGHTKAALRHGARRHAPGSDGGDLGRSRDAGGGAYALTAVSLAAMDEAECQSGS